ncbi:LysR family transcriptional regulator [Sphingomonas sp. S-NIH.Pt3_0716]|jgi:DNA-binding transcriptional LysR family regulator|nr:LysR family transcriptional regulator [Sphingomonas sp. S-NIH.Pt3_0716]
MISAISNLDDKMNTLDLDAVKIFLMIVELRSFTKAAAAMDLAQSAVSTKLRKLETELGHQLVERTPRSVQLSAAGAMFLQPARDLITAHDLALSSFGSRQRRLSIGFSNHIFGPQIPAMLSRLHSQDPGLVLEMKVGTTREIMEAMDCGSIGAAFVLPLDETRRGGEVVGQQAFGWMAAPGWTWDRSTSLPIVVQPSPCAVRAMTIRALEDASIPWMEAFVGGGVATIAAAAAAGLAVAALGRQVAPADVIDMGAALHLPPLPAQDILLYSSLSDGASRKSLRLIGAMFGSVL